MVVIWCGSSVPQNCFTDILNSTEVRCKYELPCVYQMSEERVIPNLTFPNFCICLKDVELEEDEPTFGVEVVRCSIGVVFWRGPSVPLNCFTDILNSTEVRCKYEFSVCLSDE